MSIVPSTGVPTASYAASVAPSSAAAITVALRSSGSATAMRCATAPSIWLRMTPELPRAPRSAPLAKAASAASGSAPAAVASRSASRAAETVRNMLVPVSPSGTG